MCEFFYGFDDTSDVDEVHSLNKYLKILYIYKNWFNYKNSTNFGIMNHPPMTYTGVCIEDLNVQLNSLDKLI